LSASTGFAAYIVVAALTSSLVESVVISVGAACLPIATARARRKRRLRRFREAWPDAIALLVSGIRAGVSLPESCATLETRGPHELQAGFASFTSTYRSSGSFRAGLERLAADMADPVADRVVAALTMAHDVGGTDLVRVLRALGDFVREDLKVRQEIEARWSWTVTAARVAAGAPWLVLVMMSTRPETALAYNSPTGVVVILMGAAATGLGYALMLRAARLPTERRLGA
ncbi:MAG: type II secretion system F family protein, partial [Actinomycetota bacterium]|nr:type II secretion system F family protein [Actinomycetota bacterium]